MSTTATEGFELRGPKTSARQLLSDLWRARSLIRVMARRDFYVRYRRPTLGVIWSLVVPIVQAAVLSVVFTVIVKIQTDIPYPVFVMSGIVPWTFFSLTLGTSVRSITGGSGIASKVYFPRAALPLANVGTSMYAYVPTVVVLVVTALVYGMRPSPLWLLLILGTLMMVLLTSAFSLVLAAMQVYFRDIAYILTAALQAWLYASAVIFPITRIKSGILRKIIILNPATGMVEMFRDAFTGLHTYSFYALYACFAWTIALLLLALYLYRRYDRVFIDLL